jgi:hypothetical protein
MANFVFSPDQGEGQDVDAAFARPCRVRVLHQR